MKNRNIILSLLALGLLALCPMAQAACPSPNPGCPGLNTADGQNALFSLTTGTANTAVGWSSLKSNTDGTFNTAVGAATLTSNLGDQSTGDGVDNTAVGTAAMLLNTTGADNTAVGAAALLNNVNGTDNSALGVDALFSNQDGNFNTAIGSLALLENISGERNTAIGRRALQNSTGDHNTALGYGAALNTTGADNTTLGYEAGFNITTGSNIIAIGSGVSGVSSVGGEVDDSCYIGNIKDAPVDGGTASAVFVDQDGKLGTVAFSSQRFKKEIRPMGQTSEAVLALKPVTFQYKHDKKEAPQFGLIAEEVAAVNPDLVVRDKSGQPLAIRYDAVTAMLLNEFLKEHQTVRELKKEIAALTATVKEQDAQIQKVSTQVELTKSPTKVVLNNQ